MTDMSNKISNHIIIIRLLKQPNIGSSRINTKYIVFNDSNSLYPD